MPNISLNEESVTIPLKLLDTGDEGLIVLHLAQDAYFVIRADVFAAYSRHRLASIRQAVEAFQQVGAKPEGIEALRTPRKRRGLDELKQQGFAVSDGSGYRLQEQVLPGVTLDLVRQELASMKDTLGVKGLGATGIPYIVVRLQSCPIYSGAFLKKNVSPTGC